MRAIKYRELKRRCELDGLQQTVAHIRVALRDGQLSPDDFSIRELAEALVGDQWVKQLNPRNCGVDPQEAGDSTDIAAFSDIVGQIVYAQILRAYTQEAFVASRLVRNFPTRRAIEGEGESPATTKRGFIVPVTNEAVFRDATHLILGRASEVGEVLGLNKEKRLLDLVIGQTNNYRQHGIDYETYYGSRPGVPWINHLDNAELIDWTDIDDVEQTLCSIDDPDTKESVLVNDMSVLVMPAYRHAANRILATPEISSRETPKYKIYDSRLAYRRILANTFAPDDAKKWWFAGDFARAFAYMESWPISVVQLPADSEAEFSQDIVVRFKASERGEATVINPRYVVRCTG